MYRWKAWTAVDEGHGVSSQRTVYITTENDNYFEAQSILKSLYGDIWNLRRD
jgi:hypothetical protein